MLKLGIKKLHEGVEMPHKAHTTDACFDIYADLTNVNTGFSDTLAIQPHTTIKIPTGIKMEIPHGCWCAIFARSGLATREGLRPANCVAVIDEPYRGEIMIPMHNDSEEIQFISHKERIAQFTLIPYPDIIIEETNNLSETDRGENGFGSSGSN